MTEPWFLDGAAATPDEKYPNKYNPQTIGDYTAEATDAPGQPFAFGRDKLKLTREQGGIRANVKPGVNLNDIVTSGPDYKEGSGFTREFQTYLVDAKTKRALGYVAWSVNIEMKKGRPDVTVATPTWSGGKVDAAVWKPIQ